MTTTINLGGAAEWLSIPDVAARLGVSAPTIQALVATGEIRSLKLGTRHRIHRSVVEALVASALPTENGETS